MLTHAILAATLLLGEPVPEIWVFSGPNPDAALNRFASGFAVSPDKARQIIDDYQKQRPELPRGFHHLSGVIGDEYLFTIKHKQGLPLAGYRVNIETGNLRHVSWDEASKLHGGKFPSGYIRRHKLVDHVKYLR